MNASIEGEMWRSATEGLEEGRVTGKCHREIKERQIANDHEEDADIGPWAHPYVLDFFVECE